MKALSLWQPHVLAIALGLKPWETRDWPTRYRGPIALQAARRKWTDAGDWHIQAMRKLRRALCPLMADAVSDQASYALLANHMHYGAVVCVADITDCVPTRQLRGRIPAEHEFWGDFSDGGRGRRAVRIQARARARADAAGAGVGQTGVLRGRSRRGRVQACAGNDGELVSGGRTVKVNRRNGGTKRTSGWHKTHMGTAPVYEPVQPSQWDLLLQEMRLTDAQALALLKNGDAPRLVKFVKSRRLNVFVPEAVLDVLGFGVSEADLSDSSLRYELSRSRVEQ